MRFSFKELFISKLLSSYGDKLAHGKLPYGVHGLSQKTGRRLRKALNIPFQSGFDKVAALAKNLGTTFDELINNPEFIQALKSGTEQGYLGEGGFGKVWLYKTSFRGENLEYVRKITKYKDPEKIAKYSTLLEEHTIMNKLRNTVYAPSSYYATQEEIYMEYMPGRNFGKISHKALMKKSRRAMYYKYDMMSRGVNHLDLHGENALEDLKSGRLSIIDFGLTIPASEDDIAMGKRVVKKLQKEFGPTEMPDGNSTTPQVSDFNSPWQGPVVTLPTAESLLSDRVMSREEYEQALIKHGADPYELTNMQGVEVGASTLVKPEKEIVKKWMGQGGGFSDYIQHILSTGTAIHEYEQARLANRGELYRAEQKVRLGDTGVRSFMDVVTTEGVIEEIKSIGQGRLDQLNRPYPMHVAQLQLYLAATGQQSGRLKYISREDLSYRKVFDVEYDQDIVDKQLAKLGRARAAIVKGLDENLINIADLRKSEDYGDVDEDKLGHEFEFYTAPEYRAPESLNLQQATEQYYKEYNELTKVKRPMPKNLDKILQDRIDNRLNESKYNGAEQYHNRLGYSVATAKDMTEAAITNDIDDSGLDTGPSGNHGLLAHEQRLVDSMDNAAKQSHGSQTEINTQGVIDYFNQYKNDTMQNNIDMNRQNNINERINMIMLQRASEGGHVYINSNATGHRRM